MTSGGASASGLSPQNGSVNPRTIKHTGQELGGKYVNFSHFDFFFFAKSVNNVCKLLELLGDSGSLTGASPLIPHWAIAPYENSCRRRHSQWLTHEIGQLQMLKSIWWVYVVGHKETVHASHSRLRRPAKQPATSYDAQARQWDATDEVVRYQHVAEHLANVLEERQIAVRLRHMINLQVRRHYCAVLVHSSVERNLVVLTAWNTVVCSLAFYTNFIEACMQQPLQHRRWSLLKP